MLWLNLGRNYNLLPRSTVVVVWEDRTMVGDRYESSNILIVQKFEGITLCSRETMELGIHDDDTWQFDSVADNSVTILSCSHQYYQPWMQQVQMDAD